MFNLMWVLTGNIFYQIYTSWLMIYKLRDQVTFTGPVSDQDLIKYYSEAFFLSQLLNMKVSGYRLLKPLLQEPPVF